MKRAPCQRATTTQFVVKGGITRKKRNRTPTFTLPTQLQSPDGQAFVLPARVAIRSIFNDTVYDTIALSSPAGRVKGAVQFPYDAAKPRVPGAARFESGGASDVPPLLGGAVDGAPAAAPTPGALRSPAPPATPAAPASVPVATIPPTGGSPPASASPPPPPAGGNSLWPFGTLGWPPGWGGSGARRTTVAAGAPAGAEADDGAAPSWRAAWGAAPAAPTAPAPSGQMPATAEADPDVCTVAIETRTQCGGRGGYCAGPQCADAVWVGACCLQPGARCVRFDEQYWECRLSPFPYEHFEL